MTRFVATDLEGTLTTREIWRGIAAYFKTHGRQRAHQWFMFTHLPAALLARAGIIDKQKFRNQWVIDQARLLQGFSTDELNALAEWVVENELWAGRRVNVLDELAQHHANGTTIVIATGAYEPMANALARRLPFDNVRVLATPLEMVNGRATGKLAAAIGVEAVKAERVRAFIGAGELVAAYGDTAADAPMLEMSAQPVAVAPDPALEKIARARGWRVL